MSTPHPNLVLTTSPFVKDPVDTAWIMWQVNLALLPVVAAAVWFYGLAALLVILAGVAGAVAVERMALAYAHEMPGGLRDGSALLTGLLLALTLPPGIPLWMAFVGGAVSIGLGKSLFGGLGSNIFNPALVGRAFLQAAFPVALTTWPPVQDPERFLSLPASIFSPPFTLTAVDGVSSATPLALMQFDGVVTPTGDLLLGMTTGSLGEAAGLLILLCGVYLAARRVINWRIPVSVLVTVFVLGAALHALNPDAYPPALFHLFAGGLMLGAIFMATDPVTSPLTQKGCWIFGIAVGAMVLVIRQFGGLPEGVMYAVLLLNALTPLINRLTQPRTFGSPKRSTFTR